MTSSCLEPDISLKTPCGLSNGQGWGGQVSSRLGGMGLPSLSQPLPWDFQAGVGRTGQREKDRREAHCLCGQQRIKDKIWGQAASSWWRWSLETASFTKKWKTQNRNRLEPVLNICLDIKGTHALTTYSQVWFKHGTWETQSIIQRMLHRTEELHR